MGIPNIGQDFIKIKFTIVELDNIDLLYSRVSNTSTASDFE